MKVACLASYGILSAVQLVLLGSCRRESVITWPDIKSMHHVVLVDSVGDRGISLNIESPTGRQLYRVTCHGSGYEGDPTFDYSGDFECRLLSLYSQDVPSSLFAERADASRDWETRARFLAEELVDDCALYPEYGNVRTFRLRGMRIVLAVSEAKFGVQTVPSTSAQRKTLRTFRFALTAYPDSGARTPIVEPVPFGEPPYRHPTDPSDFSKACDVLLLR